MSSLDVSHESVICSKCGRKFGKRKGNFATCYQSTYKGLGTLTICNHCLDTMYNECVAECKNTKLAVRQVCRKLDLYWNEKLFERAERTSSARSLMSAYMTGLTGSSYAGKCYDDTLREENTYWEFGATAPTEVIQPETESDGWEPSDDVVAFWGTGLSNHDYHELEQRREYWMTRYPNNGEDLGVGTEALIRQICNLEIDINKLRAEGKPIDKSVNMLNTLLGSANLKPVQKKEDSDSVLENTPFGVWVQKWETQKPIPEPDPELKDTDGLVRYISIWFLGHLCKMLNIKNTYSKLYEDEMERLRVDKPEYEEEDDETLFNDIFDNSASSDEYDDEN